MPDPNSPQELIRKLLNEAGSDEGEPVDEAPSTKTRPSSPPPAASYVAPLPITQDRAPAPESTSPASPPAAPVPATPEPKPALKGGLSLAALKDRANANRAAAAPKPDALAPYLEPEDTFSAPVPESVEVELPESAPLYEEEPPETTPASDFPATPEPPDLLNDRSFDHFAEPTGTDPAATPEPASEGQDDFLARLAALRAESEAIVARANQNERAVAPSASVPAPTPAPADALGGWPQFNLDLPATPSVSHPAVKLPPLEAPDQPTTAASQVAPEPAIAPEIVPAAQAPEEDPEEAELDRLHREATERAAAVAARRNELAARKIREAAERERAAMLAQTNTEIVAKRAELARQQQDLDDEAAALEQRKQADLIELEGLRGKARSDAEAERAALLAEANAEIADKRTELFVQQQALDEAAAALEVRKQAYVIELEAMRGKAKSDIDTMWNEVRAEKAAADEHTAAAEATVLEAEAKRTSVANDQAALETRTEQERERITSDREALRSEMESLRQAMISEAMNQAASLSEEVNRRADTRISTEFDRVAEKERQVDARMRALLAREQQDRNAQAAAEVALRDIAQAHARATAEAERWHTEALGLSATAAQADQLVAEMTAELEAAKLSRSTEDDAQSEARVQAALLAQVEAETASQRAQAELARANEVVVSLSAQQQATQARAELAEAAIARNQEARKFLDVQQEGVRETRQELEVYRDQFGRSEAEPDAVGPDQSDATTSEAGVPAESLGPDGATAPEEPAPGDREVDRASSSDSATPEASEPEQDLFGFDLGDLGNLDLESEPVSAEPAIVTPVAQPTPTAADNAASPAIVEPGTTVRSAPSEDLEAPDERLPIATPDLDFGAQVAPPALDDEEPDPDAIPQSLATKKASRRNPLKTMLDEAAKRATRAKPVAPAPAPTATGAEPDLSLNLDMFDEPFPEVPDPDQDGHSRRFPPAPDHTSAMPSSLPEDVSFSPIFEPITEPADPTASRLGGLDYAHATKPNEAPSLHFTDLHASERTPVVLGVDASAVNRGNFEGEGGGLVFTLIVTCAIILIGIGVIYFFGGQISSGISTFFKDPGGALDKVIKTIEHFFGT